MKRTNKKKPRDITFSHFAYFLLIKKFTCGANTAFTNESFYNAKRCQKKPYQKIIYAI